MEVLGEVAAGCVAVVPPAQAGKLAETRLSIENEATEVSQLNGAVFGCHFLYLLLSFANTDYIMMTVDGSCRKAKHANLHSQPVVGSLTVVGRQKCPQLVVAEYQRAIFAQ